MRILISLLLSFSMGFTAEPIYGPEIELRTKLHSAIELSCASPFIFLPSWMLYESIQDENLLEGAGTLVLSTIIADLVGQKTTFKCSSKYSEKKMHELVSLIQKNCLKVDCHVKKIKYKTSHTNKLSEAYRIQYPDGNWFQVSTDFTAVEIQMKPMSSAEIKKFIPILQRDMFDVANSIHLNTPKIDVLSGGHISIGFADTFKENPLLFRNFLVDQMNHSELQDGIFLKDPISAKNVYRNQEIYHFIQDTIQQFDRGEIKTSEELARILRDILKANQFIDLQTITRDDFPNNEKRVELRAHRSQKNAEEFYKLTKLYDGRINFLKTYDKPINLRPMPIGPNVKTQLINFQKYVIESGEEFEPYLKMLPTRYQVTYQEMHYPNKCRQSILSILTKFKPK